MCQSFVKELKIKEDNKKIKKKLEQEKQILDTRIDDSGISPEETVRPKRKKTTWRTNQKIRRVLLSARASQKKKEVDKALERLDKGEYGKCLNCGKQIDPKRLEVMPATVLCYECSPKDIDIKDIEE